MSSLGEIVELRPMTGKENPLDSRGVQGMGLEAGDSAVNQLESQCFSIVGPRGLERR